MKRINNPSKYLKEVLKEGDRYYIGFGIKELTALGASHPDIVTLRKGVKSRVNITGKKGPLKENTQGKFVRKDPGVKTSIWRHIEYYSRKWEKWIKYDREFNIWEKELLHQFNLELKMTRTPQNEIIFHFPVFVMTDNEQHYLRAGAAMNITLALCNYYALYDTNFNPLIPITQYKDKSLLPSGISNRPVTEKMEAIEQAIHSEQNVESTGNSYRFAVLKEQSPSDVTIGKGGFDDYLIFEFKQKNLLVFENLKSGNATYIFKQSKFDPDQPLDKQTALKHPGFLKRVVHENMSHWSSQLGGFF